MIRAGRLTFVRTTDDLAEARGLSRGTYMNRKLHSAPGHPAPISSPGARVLLWDGEQVDAFYNPDTEAIPQLPTTDSEEDLLDRNEAAALRGLTVKTWDSYKPAPQLKDALVVAGGVEHWPRSVVRSFRAAEQPKKGGRPKGAGDLIPRDELRDRAGQLLDENPSTSGAHMAEALGVHLATAQRALTDARGQRIADLVQADQKLTTNEAARRLGYPTAVLRSAEAAAETELRLRRARPYLESVCRALSAAGIDLQGEPPTLQVLDGGVCAAAVVLAAGGPAPALVWDQRWGWRTGLNRRHPISRDHSSPPEGDGIRYLGGGTKPEPEELLARLRDGRRGSRGPAADDNR